MQYTDKTKNNISSFVEGQLPWFVRTQFDMADTGDTTKIVKFLEFYYKWLEKEYDLTIKDYDRYSIKGLSSTNINQVVNEKFNLFNALNRILDFGDIDNIPYTYLKHLRSQLMPDVPEQISADVRNTMKLIRDFNTRKGTKKAFEFMFRVLYNKNVDVIPYEEQLMVPSSAKWRKPILMRVELISTENTTESDLSYLIGYHVRGETSGATARVLDVNHYYVKTYRVTELVLDKNDITGSFANDEYLEGVYIQSLQEIPVSDSTNIVVNNRYRIHALGTTTLKTWIDMGAKEATIGHEFILIKAGIGTGTVITSDNINLATETVTAITRPDTTEQIRVKSLAGIKEIHFQLHGSGHTLDDDLVVSNNGSATGITLMETGSNYAAGTYATVGGSGTGLTITVTVSGNAISGGSIAAAGLGYADNDIVIVDDNQKNFNAQTAVNLTDNTITIPSHGLSTDDTVNYKIGSAANFISKTFNAQDDVFIESDSIRIPNHGFYDTDKVVYTKGSGTVVTGLTTGNTYYIVRVSADTIKLATSWANSTTGTVVDLTGLSDANENHTIKESDLIGVADTAIGGLANDTDYDVIKVDDDTIQLKPDGGGSAIDLTAHGGNDENHSIRDLAGAGSGSGGTFKITGVDNQGGAYGRIQRLTKGKVDDILINDGGANYAFEDQFQLIGTYLQITETSGALFAVDEYIIGEKSRATARIRGLVGNKLYIDTIRGNFDTDKNRLGEYEGENILKWKNADGTKTEVSSGNFVVGTSYLISRGGANEYYGYNYGTDFTQLGAENSDIGTIFTATGTGSSISYSAGNFVIGTKYTITAPGNTDFTLLGAANSSVGTVFTATGVGTMGQTGTAELFDNTGAAIPRTTFGRCRWIVSEDSTIGSGEVVSTKSTIVLDSNPGTLVIGKQIEQAGGAVGTLISQSGTTLVITRSRVSTLAYTSFSPYVNTIDVTAAAGADTTFVREFNGATTNIGSVASVINGEIEEVELHYGGSGFEESPYLQVTSTSGQGANFTPFGSKIGGILKAIAVTPGVNYGKNTTVSSQEKTIPWTTAKGIARTDIVIDFDGKYLDSRGFLSGDSVIQDGRLYTPWSYVVGSDMQYEEWVGPISKIAHPVGTKIFPTYYINTTTSAASTSHSDVTQATT